MTHHEEQVMGTVVTIDLYSDSGPSAVDLSPLLNRARAILQHADNVFSTWKLDSPMSRIRRKEITSAQAPPEVAEVLQLCGTARELTDGWFDPWAMPGGVDPTGYVKGWAAQQAADALASPAITGAIVNAAGDIASFGGVARTRPFRFGIVDPLAPGRIASVVELSGALATSGTYERGHHLFDPNARRTVARVASATVSGPDLGLADALATAVAVAGEEGLQFVHRLDGYQALTISFEGTMQWTPGFPFARSTTV